MTDNIGLHEPLAIVSPQDFSREMSRHWTNTLQLFTSQPLERLWQIMAESFERAIKSAATSSPGPWLVLQPPTGSGKTQGTCVYAAMQAHLNLSLRPTRTPVGLVILTRRIAQADEIVSTINDIAGLDVAVAHHSQSKATEGQLRNSDVLVATHQAYVMASQAHGIHKGNTWERLVQWRGGRRLLTIIDEALENVIESNQVTEAKLRHVLGYIPLEVRLEYPQQYAVLQQLHQTLLSHVNDGDGDGESACMVWQGTSAPSAIDMNPLRAAMSQLPYDTQVLLRESVTDRLKLARQVDDVLHDAEAIMDQWAYYAQKGNEHTFNSAALVVPMDAPGTVVLDATARANFLWELVEDRAHVVPVPSRVRDYSPVTLHVSRATGLGKHSMTKHIATRCPRLLDSLEAELGHVRSVFLCMHQATEHHALRYQPGFAQFAVGHWGAIDGRNDWQEYDTAVIFGLPYRDQIWANNTFFSLQGERDNAWLRAPAWKSHVDVRAVMEQRQLSVSIIQAVNRIRCRRVVDTAGRCPPADIFVVLPNGGTGEAILRDICDDMPGINVVPWAFELDGPKVRRPRNGSSHAALVSFMNNRLPGETPMTRLQRELGLEAEGLKSLRSVLRNESHPTTAALLAMGVEYCSIGRGRGAKSYLVKHAPN